MIARCPGCQACIESRIPDFPDDQAEEAFWDLHSPSQFPLRPAQVRLRGRPAKALKKQRVTLMLNPRLKEHLVELADRQGLGYQTLIQQYLLERVEQELTEPRGRSAAPKGSSRRPQKSS